MDVVQGDWNGRIRHQDRIVELNTKPRLVELLGPLMGVNGYFARGRFASVDCQRKGLWRAGQGDDPVFLETTEQTATTEFAQGGVQSGGVGGEDSGADAISGGVLQPGFMASVASWHVCCLSLVRGLCLTEHDPKPVSIFLGNRFLFFLGNRFLFFWETGFYFFGKPVSIFGKPVSIFFGNRFQKHSIEV